MHAYMYACGPQVLVLCACVFFGFSFSFELLLEVDVAVRVHGCLSRGSGAASLSVMCQILPVFLPGKNQFVFFVCECRGEGYRLNGKKMDTYTRGESAKD